MNASSSMLAVRSALAASLALALLLPAGIAHAEDDSGVEASLIEESATVLNRGESLQETAAAEEEASAAFAPFLAVAEEAPVAQEEARVSETVEAAISHEAPSEPEAVLAAKESETATEESAPLQVRAPGAVASPETLHSSIAAAMLPQRTVSGTVTDAGGSPVPATVTLSTPAGDLQVVAGLNGAFSIPDVPVGSYQYTASFPGRVGAWGTAALTPQSGHQLDLVMSLYSEVSGRVVDVNGQGIGDVLVMLLQPNNRSQSVRTAADGTYAIQNIEPGEGVVQFMGPQGSVFSSAWWPDASARSEATVLTFPKAGTALTGIDAQLRASAVAVGYVLMPDDSPVDRAVVIVRDSEGAVVFEGSSDATGRFATTGLPLGDYAVQAWRWLDAEQIELTSAEQSFTMSGQPYNLQPLILDREPEIEPVPVFRAVDDSYATPKNTLLQVSAPGVLGNDDLGGFEILDPEEAAFAVEGLVTATTHGEVLLAPDGSFVYQPDDDFVGTDSFTYTLYELSDAGGVLLGSNTPRLTATVIITVGAEGNGGNNGSGQNGGTGTSDTGNGVAGGSSNGNTTSGDTSTIAESDRLAHTGLDGSLMLWVLGIAAFLLLDGAALLIIMHHRRRRVSAVLEGIELTTDEGQER